MAVQKRFYAFIAALFITAFIGVFLILQEKSVPVSVEPIVNKVDDFQIQAQTSTTTDSNANSTVLRVIDGDTLVARLDNEPWDWTIRMLGINTPETVDPRKPVECFGKEASEKLKSLLPPDSRIRLAPDPKADERDKYDRLLRNVFLADDTDVNALMVRDGFAYAYLSFPLDAERKKELKELETTAKQERRGLWGEVCGATR
ncbi:MAG: thermonuclease family protein [Patescibacteria group bacterium]